MMGLRMKLILSYFFPSIFIMFREREICLFASNLFNKLPLKTHTQKKRFYILKLNKLIISHIGISNQKALLRYDAGVGGDKSHFITTPSLFKSFITNNLINYLSFWYVKLIIN